MSRRRSRSKLRLTGSNLLQTGVTIAVAVLVAAAGLVYSEAASEWQSSVRQEVKRSAALLQDAALVYGSEAPVAFDLAVLRAGAGRLTGADARARSKALFSLDQA